MSSAAPLRAGEVAGLTGTQVTNLLELVRAIGEVTNDDFEIVTTVLHLLHSGRVRLSENFRSAPFEAFD
jgi:hypothetical protein